ncbi:MAG TPA: adenylyltransferase/cytidyltransferase family protein [Blastocatellia bacterium]|nr:adenylyltransferase/cytidyltransferase family protein [Blastocatellia bacterium]
MGKVVDIPQLVDERTRLKSAHKRLVMTNGCFDIIHPGHISYLRQAKSLGDCLAVALNTDRAVGELKGPKRPIFNEIERCEVISALEMVDYAVIFDDVSPQSIIATVLPDVLVKGGDWSIDRIIGRAEVEAAGGTVISLPYIEGSSTTDIVDRILSRYGVSQTGGAKL